MSILESIRRRAGIFIVIAIGASMLIFILEDALTSGRFFFGGNESTVAVVNGKKVDYKELNNKVEELVSIQKLSRGADALDNQTYNQTVQGAYQDMVSTLLLGPEFKKLGISVTDSELVDLMLGSHPAPEIPQYFTDPNTGRLYEPFVNKMTGGINMTVVLQYVKQMDDKAQASWQLLEYQIKTRQAQSKYFDLIKNGLFVTDAEAKQLAADESQYYNISYVLKKYSSIPDNSVTVNDQDIQSYYNQHLYEYNQTEESRKVDYITFLATPTAKDIADLERLVDSTANTFKTIKPADDSAYIVAESDNHMFDVNYHKVGTMAPSVDSVMSHCEKGYVYGPFKDNNQYRIAKLLDIAYLPDSAKASHILIQPVNNDWNKAKLLADSLKKVVTVENFAEMAKKYSHDGSASNGGDLGWFSQGKMVPEFERACFFGKKGDIVEVRSQYGYHIIYIADQGEKSKYVHVGLIMKNIGPSNETMNDVYAQASSFAGKHPTSESYEQSADQMNKRVADLKENDQTVAGIQNPKDLIRWVYGAKEGDISPVFDVGGDRYVVAHIMAVTAVGTIPLVQIKDQLKPKVIQEKKAEKLMEDMKGAAQGATNIASVAQKAGVPAQRSQRLSFQMYSIPGLGQENAVLGAMTALKLNGISQPIQGEQGVYVIQVDSVFSGGTMDVKAVQYQQMQTVRNKVQYDAYDALQKKAGLVSHLGKFY
ncbi:MAG TPA: peptidylprolyl isomerase [Bacteroidia bacterium]|nr:peptidylprolyl isomerase [Bacteroidia bacterium]